MRLALFLALLVLASHAFAQDFKAAIAPYVFSGESAEGDSFAVNGTNYVLVLITGKPSFLLQENGSGYSLVDGEEGIRGVLVGRKMASVKTDAQVDQAIVDIRNFNASREPAERQCKQYTGLLVIASDRDEERPCFFNSTDAEVARNCFGATPVTISDRVCAPPIESCLVACRTVPICSIALSNNLHGIYQILFFRSATRDLDSNVSALLAELEGVRSLDRNAADASTARLGNVLNLTNTIVQNWLFYEYSFCSQIPFNGTALFGAEDILKAVSADIADIEALGATSAQVANFTKERMRMREAMGKALPGNVPSENLHPNVLKPAGQVNLSDVLKITGMREEKAEGGAGRVIAADVAYSGEEPVQATLVLRGPAGFSAEPQYLTILLQPRENFTARFALQAPENAPDAQLQMQLFTDEGQVNASMLLAGVQEAPGWQLPSLPAIRPEDAGLAIALAVAAVIIFATISRRIRRRGRARYDGKRMEIAKAIARTVKGRRGDLRDL